VGRFKHWCDICYFPLTLSDTCSESEFRQATNRSFNILRTSQFIITLPFLIRFHINSSKPRKLVEEVKVNLTTFLTSTPNRRRDLMIPPISAQRGLGTTFADSLVFACCQLLCFASESPDYSLHLLVCTLTAHARLHVWSFKEELRTALHISALAGTCYVTRRRGQESFHRDSTKV
jgi:hypothetical protein